MLIGIDQQFLSPPESNATVTKEKHSKPENTDAASIIKITAINMNLHEGIRVGVSRSRLRQYAATVKSWPRVLHWLRCKRSMLARRASRSRLASQDYETV